MSVAARQQQGPATIAAEVAGSVVLLLVSSFSLAGETASPAPAATLDGQPSAAELLADLKTLDSAIHESINVLDSATDLLPVLLEAASAVKKAEAAHLAKKPAAKYWDDADQLLNQLREKHPGLRYLSGGSIYGRPVRSRAELHAQLIRALEKNPRYEECFPGGDTFGSSKRCAAYLTQ